MIRFNKKIVIFFLAVVIISVGIVIAAIWFKKYQQKYELPSPPTTLEEDITESGSLLKEYVVTPGSHPPLVRPGPDNP